MYAGGCGGLLFDPVSTWLKFEECTLNLGSATSVEDNNTVFTTNVNTNEEFPWMRAKTQFKVQIDIFFDF